MRHPAPRRTTRTDLAAAASVVLAVVYLTGCGGDEAPEEARAFCSALKTIEELEDDGQEAFAEALVSVDEVAPPEVADDTAFLVTFIEFGTEIGGLPAEKQETALEEFSAMQPQFDAALVAVEDYAKSNCPNLEESFFGS